jgi:hypothetical protein
LRLYITNVQDETYISQTPFNVTYVSTQNINPVGGTAFFQIGNPITLSKGDISNTQYVYLGVYLSSTDNNHTVTLNNGIFSYKMMSQPSAYSEITPTVILT